MTRKEKYMAEKKNKRAVALIACVMAAGLIASPIVTTAEAGREVIDESKIESRIIEEQSFGRTYLSLATVKNKNVWSYQRPSVSINGKSLSVKGIIINGTYYIPTRAAANALGLSYSYNSSTKTATMTASGLKLVMSDGCYVNYANDRTLFATTPNVIMSDGRMYAPLDSFVKAIGMTATKNESSVSISGSFKPLIAADKFYRSDEVLWLARIIHAEANGEPLLGQIAVGNVVLNRVRSPYYPNTIYGVIFDRKYGVQFSPILNGTIYNTPCYNSTLAAKICLEGFDISGGAFFFLEPHLATSSWIPQSRTYAFTIGNHDFYL